MRGITLPDLQIALANLTSVAVLCFALGFIASRLLTDIRIPDAVYQVISIYLLFGIGLKGGHSLKDVTPQDFLQPALTTIGLGILIPVVAFLGALALFLAPIAAELGR